MKQLWVTLLLAFTGTASAADALAVHLHGQRFSAELARDDASRARGLMMRNELAPDHSMLFVFPNEEPRSFWMKNTLVPLDILYFDGKRRLVAVQAGVPPCKADPCPSYPSKRAARYVLELPGGTAARIGVALGDELMVDGTIGPVH